MKVFSFHSKLPRSLARGNNVLSEIMLHGMKRASCWWHKGEKSQTGWMVIYWGTHLNVGGSEKMNKLRSVPWILMTGGWLNGINRVSASIYRIARRCMRRWHHLRIDAIEELWNGLRRRITINCYESDVIIAKGKHTEVLSIWVHAIKQLMSPL